MQREQRGVRRSQLCLNFAHAAQERRRVRRMGRNAVWSDEVSQSGQGDGMRSGRAASGCGADALCLAGPRLAGCRMVLP
jgi:hypothetical protein